MTNGQKGALIAVGVVGVWWWSQQEAVAAPTAYHPPTTPARDPLAEALKKLAEALSKLKLGGGSAAPVTASPGAPALPPMLPPPQQFPSTLPPAPWQEPAPPDAWLQPWIDEQPIYGSTLPPGWYGGDVWQEPPPPLVATVTSDWEIDPWFLYSNTGYYDETPYYGSTLPPELIALGPSAGLWQEPPPPGWGS